MEEDEDDTEIEGTVRQFVKRLVQEKGNESQDGIPEAEGESQGKQEGEGEKEGEGEEEVKEIKLPSHVLDLQK